METYSALRAFADTWGLLVMFLIFVGIVFWVFRPGARAKHDDAANMIFRNETKPKDDKNGD
jgi:cytochrome c oxidase cbb3-type subunit IV